MDCTFFIIKCGIAHFLCTVCVLCTYSTFKHHPYPLGYLCAEFCFLRGLHCWASLWRKIAYSLTHSLTQSLTQLIWCAGNRKPKRKSFGFILSLAGALFRQNPARPGFQAEPNLSAYYLYVRTRQEPSICWYVRRRTQRTFRTLMV